MGTIIIRLNAKAIVIGLPLYNALHSSKKHIATKHALGYFHIEINPQNNFEKITVLNLSTS